MKTALAWLIVILGAVAFVGYEVWAINELIKGAYAMTLILVLILTWGLLGYSATRIIKGQTDNKWGEGSTKDWGWLVLVSIWTFGGALSWVMLFILMRLEPDEPWCWKW